MNTQLSPRLEAGGLRVQFILRGDRHAHEIWLRDGVDWVCVLESVEGSEQDSWPDSPPLQSLHLKTSAAGRPLALLVGMAGTNHWSASIAIDAESSQGDFDPKVDFDIACRVRGAERGILGNRYRARVAVEALDEHGATFALSSGKRLRLIVDQQWGAARLEPAEEGVRLVVSMPSSAAAAETIRWGYSLELAADRKSVV